ncbi:MAG: heparan-alpha-glucosaminide N-acetyltransferase domain-containing protein [Acidobacteriota bacterium]|nr:heparan-alpha-glucosaminide N-acetyltransferase domain-containing protein [Acidobacteriota bacterium]
MSSQVMAARPSLSQSPGRSYRIQSIDVLRGVLMVVMALDHSRDYFSGATVNPSDPAHSWPALFATRWITHICAPGFILLAGTSVYLQRQRKSAAALTRFLLTRGLWLIFIELTVVSFGWSFNIGLPIFQVIWAIGASMIVLAGLQWLPVPAIGLFAAIVIFGEDMLDRVHAASFGRWSNVWRILHERGPLVYHRHPVAIYGYPLIPWVAVMALGFCFGTIVVQTPERRQRISALIGAASLAMFAVLRLTHGYGDPGAGWQRLGSPAYRAMSFFAVEKYPPSLHYLLGTLGVVFLLFAVADHAGQHARIPRLRGWLDVYGRVPFFFYILHIFLIHALALGLAVATRPDWRYWITPDAVFTSHLEGWGYGLPVVYAVWLGVVLVLYPWCAWFSRLKDRRRDWWLSYL